jgi:hypothetical protein
VNASAPPAKALKPGRLDPLLLVGIVGLTLITFALLIIGNGNVPLALAPLAVTLVLVAAIKAPLRHSMLVLGFLCLTLENPSEAPAAGMWKSPLYIVGALFLSHINVTIPIKALFFSGLDLAIVFLAGLWVYRRIAGDPIDRQGFIPVAAPVRNAALGVLGTMTAMLVFGMTRSEFSFANSLWQIFRIVYLPIVFLLYAASIRGPADVKPLAITLMIAAVLRACIAGYVRHLFPDLEQVPHATVHADSMLFANVFVIILVMLFHRLTRKNLALAACVLPILTWGMIANNRRLVWVEVGICLIVVYVITPFTRLKRRIAQTIVILAPLIVVYSAVGWNHPTGPFAPVKTIRSVIDSKADTSTLWRDFENYNLYTTVRSSPIVGIGLGHEYIETIHLPDISTVYPLYRYAPHNSILGLFAYGGFLGFAGIWMLLPVGVFFAVRNYRWSQSSTDKTTALACLAILVTYMFHCYGDMALGTWNSVFTVGCTLALIGKQAIVVGAWPAPGNRPRPQPNIRERAPT